MLWCLLVWLLFVLIIVVICYLFRLFRFDVICGCLICVVVRCFLLGWMFVELGMCDSLYRLGVCLWFVGGLVCVLGMVFGFVLFMIAFCVLFCFNRFWLLVILSMGVTMCVFLWVIVLLIFADVCLRGLCLLFKLVFACV